MFYVFLLLVAALGALVYLAFFMSQVPGAKEERLGQLEPLPPHLGKWLKVDTNPDEKRIREERHLLGESNGFGGSKLLLQVRYRDPISKEIVEIMPEERIRRKRIRP